MKLLYLTFIALTIQNLDCIPINLDLSNNYYQTINELAEKYSYLILTFDTEEVSLENYFKTERNTVEEYHSEIQDIVFQFIN